MSVETLSSITGQSPERVNVGVVKLREGAGIRHKSSASFGRFCRAAALAMATPAFVQLEQRFWKSRDADRLYSTSAPRSDS